MARNDLSQTLVAVGGVYILYKLALNGTLGPGMQRQAFAIQEALQGGGGSETTETPSSPPDQSSQPPSNRTDKCDFIPGRRYVAYDAHNDWYSVVWGGQVIFRDTSLSACEQRYNREWAEKGCSSGA